MGFNEIFTLDAVLMQLGMSGRQARVVAMHYYPTAASPPLG